MWFEGRELRDYAEPVTADILQTGKVYFSLQFIDEELLIPQLQPLIFLGRNLEGRKPESLTFQNYESYCRGMRIESADANNRQFFEVASVNGLNHIFEYERALEVLMSCALKRQNLGI